MQAAAAYGEGRGVMDATEHLDGTRTRIMSAARAACARFRVDQSWADDLCQEVVVMQLCGERVRLARRGLGWILSGLLKGWLSSRVKPETVQAYVRQNTLPASDPMALAELQKIYGRATPAQQAAIVSLMMDGQHTSGGSLSRQEQQRRGQALYTLRKKIARQDAEVDQP